MIHLQTSPDIMTQIPLFSGVIFALVNVAKRVSKRIDGGWTLVVALGMALVFGSIIAFAEFQVIRDFIYGVAALFLGALGIHGSGNLSPGEQADAAAQSQAVNAEITAALAPADPSQSPTSDMGAEAPVTATVVSPSAAGRKSGKGAPPQGGS